MAETRKTKSAHLTAMPTGIIGAITAQELRDLIESVHPHQAATDPDANDDSSQGFDVGHTWRNTSDDGFFICVDNTNGAAVWLEVGGGGGGTGTVHDHRFLFEEDDGVWRDVEGNAQNRTWDNPTTFRTVSQPRVLPPLNSTTGFRAKFDTFEAVFGDPRAVLVVGDTDSLTAADDALQAELGELGFGVTLQSQGTAAPTSGFEVAVISESVGSPQLGSGWDTTTIPVLSMELGAMDTMLLVDNDNSTTLNATGTQLRIIDDTHDAAGDLSNGLVTVYTASNTFAHVAKAGLPAGGDVIAEKSDDSSEAVVVTYDSGSTLTSGTAPARRAVYGHGYQANVWTTDGTSLFGSLIYWVAGYPY